MAEGTKLNASTIPGGDTIDTEQVGSVKVPRSKIVLGDRDADGGDVSTGNPMPVVGLVSIAGTPTVAVANFPATQPISASALPLPTGAAADVTITARLGTLGQKASAASAPVVLASDQSAIPVSGTVTLTGGTDGLALDATLTAGGQKAQTVDAAGHIQPSGDAAARAIVVALSDAISAILGTASAPLRTDPTGTTTQPISAAALPLPAGAATESTLGTRAAATQLPAALVGGRLDENVGAWLGSTAPTVGSKTSASSIPVVIASDQGALPVSAASLPLPTGAAQDATLTGGGQKTQVVDGSGHVMPTGDAVARSLAVQVNDGTNVIGSAAHPVKTDPTGTTTQPVSATSLPLPTGAAQDATLTGGTAKAQVVDASGHVLPASDVAARALFAKMTDGTNTAAVKAASTAAAATDPALVVAINPTTTVSTTLANGQQTPLSNATVTSSGSAIYTGLGHKEFNLVINIKSAPTGTTPTLTFQLQELDPGDQTTTIGAAVVGTALNAVGTQTLKLPDTITGCVKVTWTIAGTSASFTGVYATVSVKPTEDTIEQFAPVAEDNTNGVIAVVLKPVAVSTYAWSVAFVTALATNLVVKASAGVMRKLFLRVDSTASTASYYIQLFNATSLPADGTGTGSMLIAPRKVQLTTLTDQNVELDFTDAGIAFSTGCVVVLSTTEFTKTISTALLSATALFK